MKHILTIALLLSIYPIFAQKVAKPAFFSPNPNVSVNSEEAKKFLKDYVEIGKKAEFYKVSKPVLETILVLQSNFGTKPADGLYNYGRVLAGKKFEKYDVFKRTKNEFVLCDTRSRGIELSTLALHILRGADKKPLTDAQWLKMIFGKGGDLESLSVPANSIYKMQTGKSFKDLGLDFGQPAEETEVIAETPPAEIEKKTEPKVEIVEKTKAREPETPQKIESVPTPEPVKPKTETSELVAEIPKKAEIETPKVIENQAVRSEPIPQKTETEPIAETKPMPEKTVIEPVPYLTGRNFVKANLTSFLFNNYVFQYERILNKKLSAALSVRFMPDDKMPMRERILDAYYGADDLDSKTVFANAYMGGWAVTPEMRYYPGKKGAGRGFYVAPFYRYSVMNIRDLTFVYKEANNITGGVNMSGKITSHTAGLVLGAQFFASKMLVFDVWLLGPHFGAGKGTFTGQPDVPISAPAQNSLEFSIDSLDIPFSDKTIAVNATSAEVKLSGPWAGFRAGFGVGLRF